MSTAQLKEDLARLASELIGVTVQADWIELANPKAGSHLALPCFRFASELGKSPNEIAELISSGIESPHLDRAEASGPYVNFWLDTSLLVALVSENTNRALKDRDSNNKTAIIEYLSPNLAKPLSIGHLRNALQGKVLARNYQNAGYEVITDNHIGDWGTVFGMWVVGFERFSSDDQLTKDGVNELGRMYIEVRKALAREEVEEKSELADLIQVWLKKIEAGDQEAWAYHKKFSKISLANVEEQMSELGIKFDHNLGESFYVKRGQEMVDELIESDRAILNEDGSVIVDLEDQGIDVPMLIRKSNGASLYHTSDIATIEYREKTWSPDTVVYVVGSEQQFHFRQLFAANKKLGWSEAELVHHWYGLIEEMDDQGNRRKMSSRENAVYMTDLLDLAEKKAEEIAPDGLTREDIKKIAYGAIVFREFSASHTGNTLFDWESMFSLSGFSGPYVQYAGVRISSIIDKSTKVPEVSPDGYDWSEQADVFWLLTRFEAIAEEALGLREFHKIAEFAYELARAWNRFYEANQVIGSGDDEPARLWFAKTVYDYLERSLYLIGIEIPSKM